MKTLSLSEAKMKLSALVENVYSSDEKIVITKNGRPSAVLVSPDEFEGWEETLAIMANADLMGEIAAASNEQAQGISQINQGLSQIDSVTQQNTASAEETASAAEELSSQAREMRQMTQQFKL